MLADALKWNFVTTNIRLQQGCALRGKSVMKNPPLPLASGRGRKLVTHIVVLCWLNTYILCFASCKYEISIGSVTVRHA